LTNQVHITKIRLLDTIWAIWLVHLLCYFTENSWNTLWTLHVWFY